MLTIPRICINAKEERGEKIKCKRNYWNKERKELEYINDLLTLATENDM